MSVHIGNSREAVRHQRLRLVHVTMVAASIALAVAAPSYSIMASPFTGLGYNRSAIQSSDQESVEGLARLSLSMAATHFGFEGPYPEFAKIIDAAASMSEGDVFGINAASELIQPAMLHSTEPITGGMGLESIRGHDMQLPATIGPQISGTVAIKTESSAITALSEQAIADLRSASISAICTDRSATGNCDLRVDDDWAQLLKNSEHLEGTELFENINSEVNRRIRYRADSADGQPADRWATAAETMENRTGDCEDYAILKMWLLAKLGVPLSDLHIVVAKSGALKSKHALLAVRTVDGSYILDSLLPGVRRDTSLESYVPMFSVGLDGIWMHGIQSNRKLALNPAIVD